MSVRLSQSPLKNVLRKMIDDIDFARLKGVAGISMYCALLSVIQDMEKGSSGKRRA